jgi:hypothetical protein
LIPSRPPKEAIDRRRQDANQRFRGEYVHTIPNGNGEQPKSTEKTESPEPQTKRKGSRKQQRNVARDGAKKPGTGYRPGRRVN